MVNKAWVEAVMASKVAAAAMASKAWAETWVVEVMASKVVACKEDMGVEDNRVGTEDSLVWVRVITITTMVSNRAVEVDTVVATSCEQTWSSVNCMAFSGKVLSLSHVDVCDYWPLL